MMPLVYLALTFKRKENFRDWLWISKRTNRILWLFSQSKKIQMHKLIASLTPS